MPYFREVVKGLNRSSYINVLAKDINPNVESLMTEDLNEGEWDKLYALFDEEYPDEYFLRLYDQASYDHKIIVNKDEPVFKHIVNGPRYSATTIGENRIILKSILLDDKAVLDGIIFRNNSWGNFV